MNELSKPLLVLSQLRGGYCDFMTGTTTFSSISRFELVCFNRVQQIENLMRRDEMFKQYIDNKGDLFAFRISSFDLIMLMTLWTVCVMQHILIFK